MSLALESLRGQRLESRCKIHTLLREGESWPVHHGDMGDFDFDFEGVLGGQSLTDVVETLRDRKDTIHGLDLMGYGQILVHANVDAGVALALTDARSNRDKAVQDCAGIDLIEGDILRKAPWKQLESWISDQNKNGFDLIISHPVGALNILPDNPFVHHRLLQRMWHLLDPNGGVLFTQIPEEWGDSINRKHHAISYASGLNAIAGIQADISFDLLRSSFGTLKLTREPQAPPLLPSSK